MDFCFWLQYHTSPSTRNVFSISGKWDPAKAEGTNVSNRSTHARYPPQTFCKDSWVFLAAGSNLALKCETTWYTLMLKSVTNSNSTSTMVQFRWGSNCATPQAFRFFGAVDVQSLSIRITNRPNNFSLFVRWCCQGRVTPAAEQWFKFSRLAAMASWVTNFGMVWVLPTRIKHILLNLTTCASK